ncbi:MULTISPECIES: hypothetical protein [unclassified Streptomyces]|uniref:hypothetical protein n=1 Tax=unclassified Streptomyces TaxID=2593676 RepID=UPI0033966998
MLGVGDGKVTIADTVPGRRQRPFAGLLCEITVGVVGGALNVVLGPVLGDLAVGALSGAVDAVADGGARREDEGSLDDSPLDEGDAADAEDGDEAPPRLGEKPLTVRDLSAVTRWVAEQFGVTDDLRPETIRVQCKSVSRRKAGRSGGSDFLNSFIAADLGLVAGSLGKDEPGPALRDYLTASTALRGRKRTDVRDEPAAVINGVQPALFPLGRWPSKTAHPLVLSQQFAVNRIVEQLADADGLYAVNGPPGTGKTTQLRDLIAAVLVMRAERLSELRRPEDAFTGQAHRWSTGTYQRSVASLKPELAGFEMVIASANNGAVENVSNEIPALESVAEEWREEASFFPEQGRLVLDGVPAWGTLAAKLGNKGNRSNFRSTYWFGPPREERAERGEGMRDVLRTAASRGGDLAAWREAVARFREARQTVLTLRDERQRVDDALLGFSRAEAAVTTAQQSVQTAQQDLEELRGPAVAARVARSAAQTDLVGPAGRRAEHRRHRPGLTAGIFTLGAAQRDWQAEDQLLAEAEQAARAAYEAHTQTAAAYDRAEGAGRAALSEAERALHVAERHLAQIECTVETAVERWGRICHSLGRKVIERRRRRGSSPRPGPIRSSPGPAPGSFSPRWICTVRSSKVRPTGYARTSTPRWTSSVVTPRRP